MRILLIIESGGGSGRHFADLACGLEAAGHEVAALYSPARLEKRYLEQLEHAGLQALMPVPMERSVGLHDLGSLMMIGKQIGAFGPIDVVHAHSSKAGALARVITPRQAARVYTPHAFRTMDPTLSTRGRLFYGTVESALAHVTDALIAVSPEEAQHALELGFAPRKVHTVLNGIPAPPAVDAAAKRRELGLSPDDIAFVFVGRLCHQKQPLRFVEAIERAAGNDNRIKGFILGDGELRPAVEAASKTVRIYSGLNAQEYLPAFDCLTMTSAYEGMPYVLVEALHAGLPIVTTNVGGAISTVAHNVNGILLPTNAGTDEISTALTAVARSAAMRERYASASRKKSANLTVDAMVRGTIRVYNSALRSRRSSTRRVTVPTPELTT